MSQSKAYLLIFDHGTTGVRATLMNRQRVACASAYQPVPQIYPQPGWVEQDAAVLWRLTLMVARQAFERAEVGWEAVAAIGITNQRETAILWDAETGEPLHNAIVWQCRRTQAACEALKQSGASESIQAKTGLVIDPYFSASKIAWLLEHVAQVQPLLQAGRLRFGTVDTWILWNLTGGRCHVTDPTNASRTLLYNIHQKEWDGDLLCRFGVPRSLLPEVKPSVGIYGSSDPQITGGVAVPVAGNAGDQQAALFGQKCWRPGETKSTFGTGAFLMMNLGQTPPPASRHGLLTTLGVDAAGQPCYAAEGSIFTAGATLTWLQDALGIIQSGQEADALAQSLTDNDGVYLVPAFVGLGTPYWDASARGAITGLTRGAGKAHLARAALEAMAYQTREVLEVMQAETGLQLEALRVDGGVSRSGFLMQFLADQLNVPVLRSTDVESTTRGAAYLCGLAIGFWDTPQVLEALPETLDRFEPAMTPPRRQALYDGWLAAVAQVLTAPAALPAMS